MCEKHEIDRVCIVCLQKDKKMISVHQKPDGATSLIEIINDCINYKFKPFESFPQQICMDCKILGLNAFKFKRKCQEALMHLTRILKIEGGLQKNVGTQTENNLLFFSDEKHLTLKELKTHQLEAHQETVFQVAGLDVVENNLKQQQIDETEELSNLPDIEEVDLKIFTENSLSHDHEDNERNEDLLVYIKQFDGITDDDDDEPLSKLQQTKHFNNSNFKVEREFKEANVEDQLKQDSITRTAAKKVDAETIIQKKKNKAAPLHQCNICEKKFTTSTYLQRHVIMHAKKRFNCKECLQNFSSKEELHEHVKTEGHDKRLLCPECGLRCRTSNILMVHLRRHKGEKPFKCKFCSKGFPRSDDLRLHEKYHTGEKSHFCGTCGKGFQRKYNLKIHLRVHTGEKPYKCPHCPQAFAQGNDLKAHIRRHTGERFRCEICDAAFLQGYQIRQHKLSEHGIKDEPPTQRVAKFVSIEAQKQQILQNMNKESL